jgi:sensor domain CHASE-containing protein
MEQGVNYLFTQGVLGVVVFGLVWVCIKLYTKTDAQQRKIEELQDARLQDIKDIKDQLSDILQGNTEASRILAEKIEAARRK